ncbi:MAG: phosphoribosylglycinamide formyltransferase [Actinobacteria bacterium]|nr:phosphoribosylglycinamide formyltransferase [Actinomycetota bacterium]
MRARIAVLVSGTGTNLQALLDDAVLRPSISLVVADRPDAGALDRARVAGVAAEVVDWAAFPDRDAFGEALLARLASEQVELVVLAGFMRILPPGFVRAFPGRILNTHPALLPAFPGAHAVRDTLEWGAKVSGVTVHLVDEEVDHGPIVLQEAVEVLSDDDEETLHERIKRVEHRLLPLGVRLLMEGRLKLDGRRVHVLGEGAP